MARFLFAKRIISHLSTCPPTNFKYYTSFLDRLKLFGRENESCPPTVCDNSASKPTSKPCRIHLPTLIPTSDGSDYFDGLSIELVDPDIWPQKLSGMDRTVGLERNELFDGMSHCNSQSEDFSDFDEIDDMRLRKRLYYKLDRDSKEFEEYHVHFPGRKRHLKKGHKNRAKIETEKEGEKAEKQAKAEIDKERKGPKKANEPVKRKGEPSPPLKSEKPNVLSVNELITGGKRVRTPTFNQLTAPFHLPFCLDICITKGSVRAAIIHRMTSRVVAVAHSISKDLKADLNSKKDAKTCAAIGVVLAQRAIEDDIHNAVYTPRKGDKIEGKLQIVLQSIIDSGIDVKVKLKQRNNRKMAPRAPVANANANANGCHGADKPTKQELMGRSSHPTHNTRYEQTQAAQAAQITSLKAKQEWMGQSNHPAQNTGHEQTQVAQAAQITFLQAKMGQSNHPAHNTRHKQTQAAQAAQITSLWAKQELMDQSNHPVQNTRYEQTQAAQAAQMTFLQAQLDALHAATIVAPNAHHHPSKRRI